VWRGSSRLVADSVAQPLRPLHQALLDAVPLGLVERGRAAPGTGADHRGGGPPRRRGRGADAGQRGDLRRARAPSGRGGGGAQAAPSAGLGAAGRDQGDGDGHRRVPVEVLVQTIARLKRLRAAHEREAREG
jgi:hypothetical protein